MRGILRYSSFFYPFPLLLPGKSPTHQLRSCAPRWRVCPVSGRRKKEHYLHYTLLDSNKEWTSKWFYIANVLPSLEVHGNDRPQVIPSWSEEISEAQRAEIQPYLNRIQSLKNKGLNGLAVVASWVRHRIQPLQEREHYGFKYTGPNDPTRMSKEELSKEEVIARVQKMLKGVDDLPLPLKEFELGYPPPPVSFSQLVFAE